MIDQNRFEKLRLWSDDPNAYASLQPGLHYFDHDLGYIAYRKVLSGNVVLGDPVAAPENLSELLSAYLKAHPHSVFNYLSESSVKSLQVASRKRMNFMHIFFDRTLDLPYTFPYTPSIQGALKKALKANVRLVERDLSEMTPEELTHLKMIDDVFINQSRAKRELGFISRSMSFSKEPDVRFFFIYENSQVLPIGFCTLDPWYNKQKIVGYQLNQFRLGSTKLWGLYLSVVSMLTELLYAEGILKLCLGGCIDLQADILSAAPSSKIYRLCRAPSIKMADNYYGLTNLSKNKFEFVGTNINRYIAAPHITPFMPLLRISRAF